MTSKRRQNIARAAGREAANMRANGSPPPLIRPAFLGVDTSDWSDLPPAQYPEDTVAFIRLALSAGEQRKTLDGFRCDVCQGLTMTVDRHPGYHPRYVDHRQFDPNSRCPGTGISLEYPDDAPPAEWVPSHEWYRPSEDELVTLSDAFIDHVLRGGLILRIIPLDRQEPTR